SFSYTPNAGFTGADEFTYRPIDAVGAGDVVAVTIWVGNSVFASDASALTGQGQPVTGRVSFGDEAGYTLTPTVAPPAHGTATLDASGDWTYAPVAGFTGTDTFAYTVTDGHGNSVSGTVAVDVVAPVAASATAATRPTAAVTVPVSFFDPADNSLTITFTQGAHGAVAFDGVDAFTYTPNSATFTGTDTFTYTVDNGYGGTAMAAVTIRIVTAPTGGG
ncbi:MAG: cadherin-like domain-containing protein, partial [Gemmataceae bacterium]|nr:cadherin-like domain-containing protein [Gemmataceae bacterium]